MAFSTQIDTEAVKALLRALEENEQDKAVALLDELTSIRESELYQQVSLLTQNLHKTLDQLDDNSLLLQAKHDIPDVTERLNYVISTTEDASSKTLESAEKVLNITDSLEQMTQGLPENERAEYSQLLSEVNTELTEIMLTQSFQDLTGQVLNRVVLIISSLEQSLIHLIDQSCHDYDSIPERVENRDEQQASEMKGIGPNVTQKSKSDTAQSQDDVDDLLGELGL